nr:MAG TPA: hypothetical protein [Caudoviricetes sp.]
MHKRGKYCVRAKFDQNKRIKFLPQKTLKVIASRHSIFNLVFRKYF